MKWFQRIVCFAVVCCVGCNLPKEPPKPLSAGPTTKEEMMKELTPVLEPLRASVQAGASDPDSSLSPEQRQQVVESIRKLQQSYGDKEFARAAFKEMGQSMIELAKTAGENENWQNTAASIDLFELLDLESPRMEFLDRQAQENLGRPKVEVKGFFGEAKRDQMFVIFNTIDRRTGQSKQYCLREGEETADLRVVKILGDNMAVRFEYLKIPGLFFDVKGPRLARATPPKVVAPTIPVAQPEGASSPSAKPGAKAESPATSR